MSQARRAASRMWDRSSPLRPAGGYGSPTSLRSGSLRARLRTDAVEVTPASNESARCSRASGAPRSGPPFGPGCGGKATYAPTRSPAERSAGALDARGVLIVPFSGTLVARMKVRCRPGRGLSIIGAPWWRASPSQRSPRPMSRATSRMRFEKPHSLSYQERTLMKLPSRTRVSSASKIDENAVPLKSVETSGSSL